MKCPKCDAEMVLRTNSLTGESFYGCSSYPNCSHVEEDPDRPEMTFEEAKKVVLRKGAHNGFAIDEVAESDEGLLYLDWLAGQPWLTTAWGTKIADAIKCYLSDPAIRLELDVLE